MKAGETYRLGRLGIYEGSERARLIIPANAKVRVTEVKNSNVFFEEAKEGNGIKPTVRMSIMDFESSIRKPGGAK